MIRHPDRPLGAVGGPWDVACATVQPGHVNVLVRRLRAERQAEAASLVVLGLEELAVVGIVVAVAPRALAERAILCCGVDSGRWAACQAVTVPLNAQAGPEPGERTDTDEFDPAPCQLQLFQPWEVDHRA